MGNYEQLKQSVSEVIRTNGNQEITGSILQSTLLTIISTVGANATFAGIATPTTNPGTPDGSVFYLASEGGTYTNFNAIELQDGLSVLMWNGTWSSQQIFGIDDVPTVGSDNLVKSGGVYDKIVPISSYLGKITDVFRPLANSAVINQLGLINGEKYHIHVDFSETITYLWLCLTDDLSGWDAVANTNITVGNADTGDGITSFDADFIYDNSQYLKYACQTSLTTDPFVRIIISEKNTELICLQSQIQGIKHKNDVFFDDPYPYYINGNGTKSNRDIPTLITTFPIKVNEGDVFVYSGGHYSTGLALVGGYSDIECNVINGFTQLLASDNKIYKDEIITIPSGVNYIIAWSINTVEAYIYQKDSILGRLNDVEQKTNFLDKEKNAFNKPLKGYIIDGNGDLATNPNQNFKVSSMLRVDEGDTVFFNGGWQNESAFNMVWGYANEQMGNPVALYPCVAEARWVIIKIPANVNYIRAWSLDGGYDVARLYLSARNPKDIPPTVLRYNTSSGSFLTFMQSNIANPSLFNRYVIEVEDGEYDLTADAITQTYGIKLPNYTKLIGLNGNQNVKMKVILSEYDQEVCTLSICRDCEIDGITFEGTKTRYTIHDDFGQDGIPSGQAYPYTQIFKNCVFKGFDNKLKTTFGSGIKAGARWYFENCEFVTDTLQAFLWHTNNNLTIAGELTMTNCKFISPEAKGGIVLRSLVSNKINNVHLLACNTTGFNFKPDGTTPNAYPDYTVDGAGNSRNATVVIEGTNFEGFTTDFSDTDN